MEFRFLMMKFVIPFAIAALAPLYGAQAESASGKAPAAVGCHPEWNKGGACRTQAHSGETRPSASAATGACHPEWSKGRACAVRLASTARDAKAQAANTAQPVRVATSN